MSRSRGVGIALFGVVMLMVGFLAGTVETIYRFQTKIIPAIQDKTGSYAYQLGVIETMQLYDIKVAYAQLAETCPALEAIDKTDVPFFDAANVKDRLKDLRDFCSYYKSHQALKDGANQDR